MNLFDAFKSEAEEHLAQAERCLMQVEAGGDDTREQIDEIFRSVHTIKGAAGYLDHHSVLQLSHAFESVLDLFRSRQLGRPTDEQIDVFFGVLDILRKLTNDITASADEDVSSSIQALNSMHEALAGSAVIAIRPKDAENYDPFLSCLNQQLMAINASLPSFAVGESPGAAPFGLLLRAAETTQNAAAYVGHDQIQEAASELVSWLTSHGGLTWQQEAIDGLSALVVKLVHLIRSAVSQQLPQAKPAEPEVEAQAEDAVESEAKVTSLNPSQRRRNRSLDASADQAPANVIRIDRSSVDGVMNLVGELIVTRNNFEHLLGQLATSTGSPEVALKGLQAAYGTLRHISERMQATVMDMRLIPVDGLFARFPKIVRDLGRQLGKDVALAMDSRDTKIDRGTAEQLSDPLLHLVRNAIDHGIEDVDQRRVSGKAAVAKIQLSARQEHQSIVIEVCDDGSGINADRIRQKAIANGVLPADEAAALSDQDTLQLVFRPGFSTAKAVSEVSGRGVGLDVVKKNIEKLRGSVTIRTEVGVGTTMRLVVPMTVAVMNAILVHAGSGIYACPIGAVQEVVRFPRRDVHHVASGRVVSLRGDVLGLKCLCELLGQRPAAARRDADTVTALILLTPTGHVAIEIDGVYRKEEIVVKPLDADLADAPMLMGAAILGNGVAILILDPSVLAQVNPEPETTAASAIGGFAHG